MTNTTEVVTVSDEISGEVASELLTKQRQLNRDPQELLKIVLVVHNTLRELSERVRVSRDQKLNRLKSSGREP